MYPCLIFFVLGGIITAIFIKILEWQRIAQQRHVGTEIHGEERILPIQEEGDEAMQPRRRVIHGLYHQTEKASLPTRGNPLRNLEELVRTYVCSFLSSW